MIVFILLIIAVAFVVVASRRKGDSGTGVGDEQFRTDTSFLIDVGVHILKRDSEGGFIKIYARKDGEIGINLSDTPLLRHMNLLHCSMEKILAMHYNLDEAVAEKFLSMTKLYIEQEDSNTAWIAFVHHYSGKISENNCRAWVVQYFHSKYPKLKVEDNSKYLCVTI